MRERFFFPENKKAKRLSAKEQAQKVLEEAHEVAQAIENDEGDTRIIEETWDCIQACEGILRKYGFMRVLGVRAMVKVKCARRGDY